MGFCRAGKLCCEQRYNTHQSSASLDELTVRGPASLLPWHSVTAEIPEPHPVSKVSMFSFHLDSSIEGDRNNKPYVFVIQSDVWFLSVCHEYSSGIRYKKMMHQCREYDWDRKYGTCRRKWESPWDSLLLPSDTRSAVTRTQQQKYTNIKNEVSMSVWLEKNQRKLPVFFLLMMLMISSSVQHVVLESPVKVIMYSHVTNQHINGVWKTLQGYSWMISSDRWA